MSGADEFTAQKPPAVVSLPREIDRDNGPALAAQLTAAISSGSPVVVADLTETTFIDSSGCHLLYQAYQEAADAGAQLRLATTQEAVLRILELMGYDQVLPTYPTPVDALTASG